MSFFDISVYIYTVHSQTGKLSPSAAQVPLVLQNQLTVVCAVVIYCYLVYKDDILGLAWWLEYVTYAVIILLSNFANLASAANTIAVERDWIVEICGRNEDKLASRSKYSETLFEWVTESSVMVMERVESASN